MKKFILLIFIFLFLLFFRNNEPVYSWGFFAHKKINHMAIFTLPEGMIGFYKKHMEYITEHAADPDRRRYANKDEAARHYIDIDHYGKYAFDSVPEHWDKAVAKYSEDTLKAYGIVPWYIQVMVNRLSEAFKKEDLHLILRCSADLGHYVADAHVPLHTAENYNGQLTNQKGIHGFWESRIPELKSEGYNYWVGTAKYIDKPLDKAWSVIKESNAEVDSVLKFEAKLNSTYPADKKYSFETRGNKLVKDYSVDYTNDYNKMLDGMVERRIRASILDVGSLWYTAWVNAGKPDLSKFDEKAADDSLKIEDKMPEELKNKKLKGHDE